MKKTILLFSVVLVSLGSLNGQDFISCIINFEDNMCWEAPYYNLTIPGNDNSWQVCTPEKTVFNSAYSFPKAILTDSTGPYPVNDTSSFIVKFVPYDQCMCAPVISGYYKFDSDTLKDFGRIEFSLDYGTTWLDALSDTVVPELWWITEKPVLTGRIHQWVQFFAYLPWELTGDTIYYRFTFISDSIQTDQDGWVIDDLALIDHTEGTQDIGSGDELNIYPNPAENVITISGKYLTGCMDISIYDIRGHLMFQQSLNNEKEDIDISDLCNGIYLVKVYSNDKYHVKRIIKE